MKHLEFAAVLMLWVTGCSQGFFVVDESGEEFKDLKVHSKLPWGEVDVDRDLASLKAGDEQYFSTRVEGQWVTLALSLNGKVYVSTNGSTCGRARSIN